MTITSTTTTTTAATAVMVMASTIADRMTTVRRETRGSEEDSKAKAKAKGKGHAGGASMGRGFVFVAVAIALLAHVSCVVGVETKTQLSLRAKTQTQSQSQARTKMLARAEMLSRIAAKAKSDFLPALTPEKCATIANAPPTEPIIEKERCSICSIIVQNSNQWNWVNHYSSLCEGVPPHAQEWCEYYACKIAQCGYFRSNTCKVIRNKDEKSVVEMSPCPAKYLCSYCLQIPHTQVFGCFDNGLH
jgi:hypothetical protein